MKITRLLPLLLFFTLIQFSSVAQQSYEIKCEMTVEEVLRKQPFDIDLAIAEKARDLLIELFSEINLVYDEINGGNTSNLKGRIKTINSLIDTAEELGMNYSMFENDLEIIKNLE